MKSNFKSLLIIVLIAYIIPGTILYFLEPHILKYFFVTATVALISVVAYAKYKKISCRIFGMTISFK